MSLPSVCSFNRTRDALHRITFVVFLTLSAAAGQAGPVWSGNIEVLYAPDDAPLDRVVMLYQQAKHYIYVSVYGLTYPRAVEALVAAKKRGVDVRMLTDQERTQEVKQHSALRTLRLAGIPIRVNQHDGLMHLKQVVIDDEINTSGSLNHTTSGNRYNDERMDIITDRTTSVRAREQFLSMWNDQVRFAEWK
ncbi:MAG TPA: phospholipase D-like domain-containing protein [Nitrospira sp.]|nr:phospholipase D-like domain-containing protein [Nitrospira sp.]